jgi:hypothetical protein
MANLGEKDGIFHIRFQFGGKEFKKSLKIRDKSFAEAAKNMVELTIRRLFDGTDLATMPNRCRVVQHGHLSVSSAAALERIKGGEDRPPFRTVSEINRMLERGGLTDAKVLEETVRRIDLLPELKKELQAWRQQRPPEPSQTC